MEILSIDNKRISHRIISIPGDGACLFSSLSYLLHNSILEAETIRNTIVRHVSSNWKRFKPLSMDRNGIAYRNKPAYTTEMSLSGTYGTTCELMAAGELFTYQFQLFQDGKLIGCFGEPVSGIKRLRFTGHFNEGHFDVLIQPSETIELVPQTPILTSCTTKRRRRYTDQKRRKQYKEAQVHQNSSLEKENAESDDIHDITEIAHELENIELEPQTPIVTSCPTKRRKRYTNQKRRKQYKDAQVHQNSSVRENENDDFNNIQDLNELECESPENNELPRKRRKRFDDQTRTIQVQQFYDRQLASWKKKEYSGFKYNPEIDYVQDPVVMVGERIACGWCGALKWKEESLGICCNSGKVQLPTIEKYPEPLHSLLTGNHRWSKHFLSAIRKFNGCFQMTSFGAKEVSEGNFMPTFKVQGQVYHLIGSLYPPVDQNPSFLQIYFLGDDERERDVRCQNFRGVNASLVDELQKMLHQHNNYISDFKAVSEFYPKDQEDLRVVIRADKKPVEAHRGVFNAPTTKEVAILIVGNAFEKRDIVLHSRTNHLMRICETHRSYDALQYPLMFCRGEDGYAVNIPQRDPNTKEELRKTVSSSDFYSFMMMERQGEENYLLLFRNLLNQFLVDMYAKIETERLNWIRRNQTQLRSEQYVHLRDAISKADGNITELGKMVVLPSTFTGGPRYMHEKTQDAMVYVRHFGRPDLFITFTCNPKWPEILNYLKEGQKPQDRHDIVTRIFHLKVKQMMKLLTKSNLFGPTRSYMYSIEWQKRGLPHVHILLWLVEKIRPESIDQIISAELPDPEVDPTLHNIVKSTMIHGPCGTLNKDSPCMVNGSCIKKYPKTLLKQTQTGEDGYPQYRRRSPADGGVSITMNGKRIDNRWVVPYNPVMTRTFSAHINVEYCNSVKSIKYICKYVNKGSDQAAFTIQNLDEVTKYETGRYISSSEAVWRIMCFPIHERYPSVMHLAVHLENGQRVYFNEDNVVDRINNPRKTTLMAFFELCAADEFARTLLYSEVPSYYTWKNNKFCRRKQGQLLPGHSGIRKDNVLGRVYTVHPGNSECYYLRLLLHEIRGPQSFRSLKTVIGRVYPTFQETCRALGLLQDDAHWDRTLEDAALTDAPSKIRELFAIMLVFCQIGDPVRLWEKHKDSLSEDVKKRYQQDVGDLFQTLLQDIYNEGLILLEDIVITMSGQPLLHFGLPSPLRQANTMENRAYIRELAYDSEQLREEVTINEGKLNDDQRKVYVEILQSVATDSGQLSFLDAPGGTGKTFLMNLLLATLRKEKKIALAVASSGIAATLLDGGKTAHSTFKLPLNLNQTESPLCNISKQSHMAKVLQDAAIIVWDECTMAHKKAIEALDRTLQDIRNCKQLMGGLTVLLAGDFRQTLPVIPRGTQADTVFACLKSSYLWPKVKTLSLKKNMRVHLYGDLRADEFCKLLLEIGDGKMKEIEGRITIPEKLCEIIIDEEKLIEKIYPDLRQKFNDMDWLRERAILTPTNANAIIINNIMLEQLPTPVMRYESVDSVIEEEDAVNYPVEFLNSLDPPGFPSHDLYLKVGAPIILLRNLNSPKLCNGTRLQVKSLSSYIVEATIFTGIGRGETVLIPRIPLISTDFQFAYKRLQFPLKLCFAMTINKAQGQSLKMAGVDLRTDCFSHGQLYVACSRVSCPENLTILQPGKTTKNVVYREVLQK